MAAIDDKGSLGEILRDLGADVKTVSQAIDSAKGEYKYCDSDKALAAKIEDILQKKLF